MPHTDVLDRPRIWTPPQLGDRSVCTCGRWIEVVPFRWGRGLSRAHDHTGSDACWDTPPDVAVWLPPEREDPPGSGLLCAEDLKRRRQRFIYSPGRKIVRLMIDAGECVCMGCGAEHGLEVDHIWPLARGGTNNLVNLQSMCVRCNARKGANV